MKHIEDLKKGDIFYNIASGRIEKYEYLCSHPKDSDNYHIVIKDAFEPIVINNYDLNGCLDRNLNTRSEANKAYADSLEYRASKIRQREQERAEQEFINIISNKYD